MTALDEGRAVRGPAAGRRHLPDSAAFVLLTSILAFFLASSIVPTPLYAEYQSEWGFSPITTTIIFSAYAVAVLVSLLTVGRLSDHVGRRPVIAAAVALQAITMLVFAAADGVPELLVARVMQGLATGAAAGAAGAALVDLDRVRGSLATAFAGPSGTAIGALLGATFAQYLPAPTRLTYYVMCAVFVVQLAGVVVMRETSSAEPGALASLRPTLAVPRAVRGPLVIAIPALIASWSLAGFYSSLGPALMRDITGSDTYFVGALAILTLATAGAISVFALRNVPPLPVLALGSAALVVGTGITLVAIQLASTAVMVTGAAVVGAGFGAGYQGAIRSVVPLAAPHQRAGVLSVLYVGSYLGMAIPVVIAGFLVVDGGGLIATSREYTCAAMAFAAFALVGTLRSMRRVAAERAPV